MDDKLTALLTSLVQALAEKVENKESKPATPKFFNLDGTPANEITSNRDDLVHADEIKDAMKSLVENNTTKSLSDPVKVVDKINNPSKVTAADKDAYGLTSAQRRWLLEYIFAVEGGYFNHPNDPGGETMYGIIKTEARAWGYNGAMRDLPKEVATEIYLKKYWKNMQLEKITDFKKAICIFDFVVNSGTRGIKVAQATVNKVLAASSKLTTVKERYAKIKPLVVDGKIGPSTIEAINTIDYADFKPVYFFMQEDTYEDLMRANSKLRSFDEGWENRMAVKAIYLSEMERQGL